ncbi:hypothetical protein A3A68_02285 [Candidatus Saccharibacteria bacterium RIFCSPLOWO2_01_FULL_48_13]|nr:MAG: hypothetical protein A2884_02060 [Candidatus Saccharibacteria bacterium RIFCSPHIGHO2_01_FULL_48_12]OGL35209.1 MAG: hypothetical protein A3F38_03000 [Candidatus Saccharibacteria bacterium RIFCSPHIGHO2_12_FULL_48_21]OGL36754.1 MAG: hypothetical protein A3A68_02285 [Candidatus Saccharibacteria bacterium RIFCSPLOWO2_01_FULL_48_13]
MLKRCRYCNKQYPESDFGVAATLPTKVYRRQKCRRCYRETKRLLIARQRKWIADYKQRRQCAKCGVSDFRVLDFHHNDSSGKDFNVADFRYKAGFARLKEEIGKCQLLCANCHRIVHYEEINQ